MVTIALEACCLAVKMQQKHHCTLHHQACLCKCFLTCRQVQYHSCTIEGLENKAESGMMRTGQLITRFFKDKYLAAQLYTQSCSSSSGGGGGSSSSSTCSSSTCSSTVATQTQMSHIIWLMADLNVPGALTNCPEDFAWPSVQTKSSPVNHSCSTSHSTSGSLLVKDPVRMLAGAALALYHTTEHSVIKDEPACHSV